MKHQNPKPHKPPNNPDQTQTHLTPRTPALMIGEPKTMKKLLN
ncbi:hypothetical protein [Candidatus Phytoplasma solani]|nr:hypothetical protein [Candidatus Phytoplasma solani]